MQLLSSLPAAGGLTMPLVTVTVLRSLLWLSATIDISIAATMPAPARP